MEHGPVICRKFMRIDRLKAVKRCLSMATSNSQSDFALIWQACDPIRNFDHHVSSKKSCRPWFFGHVGSLRIFYSGFTWTPCTMPDMYLWVLRTISDQWIQEPWGMKGCVGWDGKKKKQEFSRTCFFGMVFKRWWGCSKKLLVLQCVRWNRLQQEID